jgi:hypothetical protein
MLETIAIVLVVLWLLGSVSSYTMGGFISARGRDSSVLSLQQETTK